MPMKLLRGWISALAAGLVRAGRWTARLPAMWFPVALFALVLAWAGHRTPVTALSVDLQTEIVAVTVKNRDAMRFVLAHAAADSGPDCLSNLIVTPHAGQRITYVRHGNGPLLIRLEGSSTWQYGDESGRQQETRTGPMEIEVGGSACTKHATPPVRLPIVGAADFGESVRHVVEPDDRSAAVLSGQLIVYGRALPDLFGIPLNWGPFRSNALYLVSQLPVPGGSIVAAGGGTEQPRDTIDADSPAWSGHADVTWPGGESPAMRVVATVNTDEVRLYLPGPRVVATGDNFTDADVIPLSLLARLTGDPNLQFIYGALGVCAAMLQLFKSVAELRGNRRREEP